MWDGVGERVDPLDISYKATTFTVNVVFATAPSRSVTWIVGWNVPEWLGFPASAPVCRFK